MKKDLGIIFGLFLVIASLIVFGGGFTSGSFFMPQQQQTVAERVLPKETNVTVKSLNVTADVVAKSADRKKGLSKRDSMPLDRGMIFIFENKGPYGIWMKDMRFAIDVIWINDDRRIVDIIANIPPESGKSDRELTVYKPQNGARYVLELNAGLAQLHDLQPGDVVNFSL